MQGDRGARSASCRRRWRPAIVSDEGKALLARHRRQAQGLRRRSAASSCELHQAGATPPAPRRCSNDKMLPAAAGLPRQRCARCTSVEADAGRRQHAARAARDAGRRSCCSALLADQRWCVGAAGAGDHALGHRPAAPRRVRAGAGDRRRRPVAARSTSTARDEAGDLLRALAGMQDVAAPAGRPGARRAPTASAPPAPRSPPATRTCPPRTEQTASNLQQTACSMEQLTGTVQPERRLGAPGQPARRLGRRGGRSAAARWSSQVVTTMDEINASSQEDRRHHRRDRRHRLPDQHPGAERRGRSRACRRTGPRLRGRGRRSAQPGPALAEAAKEIKGLIGASVDKVEAGSRLVADAGSTMNEIVGSVQRVSDIIGEITAAAAEQSDGIGQVNTAVTQLDQMTQQNAALVERVGRRRREPEGPGRHAWPGRGAFRLDGAGRAAAPAGSDRAASTPAPRQAAAAPPQSRPAAKPLRPIRCSCVAAAPASRPRPLATATGKPSDPRSGADHESQHDLRQLHDPPAHARRDRVVLACSRSSAAPPARRQHCSSNRQS